jgi:thiol-disulfide isomerase/thioredoxin
MNAAIIAVLLQTALHMTTPPTPVPSASVEQPEHPESRVYLPDEDANSQVDDALLRAKTSGKTVLVIMGANWCHDSIGLAGWLETPRFVAMMRDRYEIVYVDVGTPQIGKGRNLDIAKRFGVKKVKGTPLVLVLSPDGKLLNSKKDAASWRNAASRSEDQIYLYFDTFTS